MGNPPMILFASQLPGIADTVRTRQAGEEFLYEQGLIGFCWTPKKQVAAMFARGLNAMESGGVLLSEKVAPEAIPGTPDSHSADWPGESEYTCDPAQISSIEVVHNDPKPS